MKTVSITEARNRLSALIDIAKAGETVVITDRGIPVVRLTAAVGSDVPEDDEARLARLERAGIIRRGTGPPVDPELLRKRLLRGDPPAGAVEALLQERREGW